MIIITYTDYNDETCNLGPFANEEDAVAFAKAHDLSADYEYLFSTAQFEAKEAPRPRD